MTELEFEQQRQKNVRKDLLKARHDRLTKAIAQSEHEIVCLYKDNDSLTHALNELTTNRDMYRRVALNMREKCEDEQFAQRKDEEDSFEAGILKGREELATALLKECHNVDFD